MSYKSLFCTTYSSLNIIFLNVQTDCLVETMLHRIRWTQMGHQTNLFFGKKSGHQEFAWPLKQFGATVIWWISNLGKHMYISIQLETFCQWNFPHRSTYPLSPLFACFHFWFVSCDVTMTSFLWSPSAHYVN